MSSGRKNNRQKKESGETNTKQKDIIHYIKKVNIDGVKQIINITKEDYEAIKDDPNQTTTALTHKQWQDINYYEAVCADPKRYQETLKKVQDKMKENCYYKKIEQDGLIKYILIEEEEYTQNKDNPNFFQALFKVFNEDRNYRGQIYIDSNNKKVPLKTYQKMTQEERNKKFTIVQAGIWRKEKSDDKKRKRNNYNNNNNNNQADTTPMPEVQNQPQNLSTILPVISEDAELLLGLSVEQSAKPLPANSPDVEKSDDIPSNSNEEDFKKAKKTRKESKKRSDEKTVYAKQIIDQYGLTKVEKISEDEYLKNAGDKNFLKRTTKQLREYRRNHQQIFVDKDNNVIEEDKYKLMSPQERADKLRKTTKNELNRKKPDSKKKAQKKSSQPVSQESEEKVYLKKISENGRIRYEKITHDEYLEYPDKDQVFELEKRQWEYLSPQFRDDDPFTHNFYALQPAFFNNSNNSSQNRQAVTSSSFTNNRPPARTQTKTK